MKSEVSREDLEDQLDAEFASVSGQPQLGPVSSGTGHCGHQVQFYEKDACLLESVSDFLARALAAGNGALMIATEQHREGVALRLQQQGIDCDAASARGQLLLLDARETLTSFMVDGVPNADLARKLLGDLIAKMEDHGRSISVFGEMVALLWADGNGTAAVQLERLWNDLAKTHSFSLLCAYPLHGFDDSVSSEMFAHICEEHSGVIPAESFTFSGKMVDEQLRSIALLQQRSRALENEVAERERVEALLREQVRTAQTLQKVGTALVSEKELEKIVQIVTDAGRELSGAAFGAFFYNVTTEKGESYTLYTLSGAPREAFERFPMPRKTAVFGPTFDGEGIVRIEDVLKDPRYGQSAPYFGMPEGHLPFEATWPFP